MRNNACAHITLHITHTDGDAVGCMIMVDQIDKREFIEKYDYPRTTMITLNCEPSHVCENVDKAVDYILEEYDRTDTFNLNHTYPGIEIDVIISDLGLSDQDLKNIINVLYGVTSKLPNSFIYSLRVYDHHKTNILETEDGMRALNAYMSDLMATYWVYSSTESGVDEDGTLPKEARSAAYLMWLEYEKMIPNTNGLDSLISKLVTDISAYDTWHWKNDASYTTCLPTHKMPDADMFGDYRSLGDRFRDIVQEEVKADFTAAICKSIGIDATAYKFLNLMNAVEMGQNSLGLGIYADLLGIYDGYTIAEEVNARRVLSSAKEFSLEDTEISDDPAIATILNSAEMPPSTRVCLMLNASESGVNAPATQWLDAHPQYEHRMTIGIIPATRCISMRGRGVDVSRIAVALGGGGHVAAAGATLTPEAMSNLLLKFYKMG